MHINKEIDEASQDVLSWRNSSTTENASKNQLANQVSRLIYTSDKNGIMLNKFQEFKASKGNRHSKARNISEYTTTCKEIDRQAQHFLQLKMQQKISLPTRPLD